MKVFFLRGVIPAFSLSLVLNFAVQAQSSEAQSPSSGASSQATNTETKAAIIAPAPVPDRGPINAPALGPIAPPIDFSIQPHAAKLEESVKFDEPELNSKTAPRAFKATAYSLRGRTASGVATRPGVVAADPSVLPLGSIVQIKAGTYSGVYTVHDTGSAVKGNLVDVWMPSSREARNFGRRSIKLQVLRYGPATRIKKSK